MKPIYKFARAALLYGSSSACEGMVFIIPEQIVSLTIFLPPILGIMWGPVAAIGVCVGGLLTAPIFREILNMNVGIAEIKSLLGVIIWLFSASYLPQFLLHKWKNNPTENPFRLNVATLRKFIVILAVTFFATSMLRTLTATPTELEAVTGMFGFGRNYAVSAFMIACFTNDFSVAVFFDLFLFFYLISKEYPFYKSPPKSDESSEFSEDKLSVDELKALKIAPVSYLVFPTLLAYLDVYQIYGMDDLTTWMNFVTECLITIDVYIVLITYLLLRYRRSIMLEIVFLVTMTVFMSVAVLGWGSSLAMTSMVNYYINDSLNAMSVICRERLDRTFFCARQAVNGMERQAVKSIESYERLANDATYRENYLATMERGFDSIAMDTDGCFAYYLRLDPKIGGNKSGFSMERENISWEGALAHFVRRDPIDLSQYSPDDTGKGSWYYTPIKNHCGTWIEPYIDPTANTYVISYVAPIFVEDKPVGVIGIDIDFNFIIQELRRMSIYDYGYTYVTDRNNIVLYHKEQIQGSKFQPNPDFREIELYLTNGMWLGIATPLSKVYNISNHIFMHLLTAILIVAILVSLGSILLVSRAIRPLAGMTEAAKRIASGDLNVTISYESGNELGILVSSIREMATKLEGYVYRDKLTGLRNAAAYMSKANELENQRKSNVSLAYGVVLFDVNFLKKVNDNYGHQAGNQLLRHASRVICRVFKHSPVYRVGGDEFVAVLENRDYENRDKLLRVFDEKIAEECFKISGDTIYVSVARGIGIYESGMEFSAVAKIADSEMYKHKVAIKSKYGEDVR